jgi:hypothetical protein
VNRTSHVLTKLTALVLLIGIAAAGCANSGASGSANTGASGSESPSQTSTAMSSQSASATPSSIDAAAAIASNSAAVVAGAKVTPAPVAGPASTAAVNLGTAGNFVLLSKSGISTTGTTKVTGSIAVSPIAATALTGFALVRDRSGAFSRSILVTGYVYAANYAAPTPANLTVAVKDMETAYTNAAGRPANVTGLGAGNIGGLTLAPGVYKWGTGVTIPTNVTLSGGANDVWIFQIAGTLTTSSATKVILAGGAQAKNVFWEVAGATTLGTYSTFNGNILDKKNIALRTGAVLNGRALAQTAITLQANKVG